MPQMNPKKFLLNTILSQFNYHNLPVTPFNLLIEFKFLIYESDLIFNIFINAGKGSDGELRE